MDELQNFFAALSRSNATREIWNISPEARWAFLYNDHIAHGVTYFFKPACFNALLSVPGGMSTLGLPETVRREDPCHKSGDKPRVCSPDLEIIPWIVQEVPIYVGDIYFIRGIRRLEANREDAAGWASIAQAEQIYQRSYTGAGLVPQMFQGAIRHQAESWKHATSISTRLEQARNAREHHELPDENFWRGSQARAPYLCASCHSG